MDKAVKLEINNKIALITLNRPDARNSLSVEMIDGLHESLDQIKNNEDVRVVILTSEGNTFSAGGDLNHPVFRLDSSEKRKPILDHIYEIPKKIHKMPIPFIAAINGPAVGGGVTLAGFCDLRICNQSSFFILNYVKMGVLPDFGGCFFLPNILGKAKSLELALLGEKIGADEALKIGFVNKVVPDDKLLDETVIIANKLASMPPLAIKLIKSSIYNLPDKSMEEALDIEAGYFNYLVGTNDCREGAMAFIEKRPPKYTGT